LRYSNPWLTWTWTFYFASQIVLRESLIEVEEFVAHVQDCDLDPSVMEVIENKRLAVQRLASTTMRSLPPLLGFRKDPRDGTGGTGSAPLPIQWGMMLSRMFLLVPAHIVQKARATSAQQKQTASDVIKWMGATYSLP
jgi:hypothetical protein